MSTPPYTPTQSAICGLPLAGQAITGVILVPPGSVTLLVPVGGLGLGARAVAQVTRQDATAVVRQPGERFGQYAVSMKVSSSIVLTGHQAGLVFGAHKIRFVGQQWLYDLDCIEEDLTPAVCTDLALVPIVCR